jgi:hypothetical protein
MEIIARSFKMKDGLDDDYTLFENGEILHEYDLHRYPGGYNLKETFHASQASEEIKLRLLEAASSENKENAKRLLEV